MAVRFPRQLKPIEPQGTQLLDQERQTATFDSKALMVTLYGEEYLKKRDEILNILENDPVLGDKNHRYYTGRDVRFQKSLAAGKRVIELLK